MLKTAAIKVLLIPGITRPLSFFTAGGAAVFMLHRFLDPDHGVDGQDPRSLRRVLAFLRRKGYRFAPLSEVVDSLLGNGAPLRRVAAFTIDDGYLDQATVGAPVFAEFDCPATTFLCTGFLDRQLWFWWDQIDFVLRTSRKTEVSAPAMRTPRIHLDLDGDAARAAAVAFVTEEYKRMPDAVKWDSIRTLAVEADVDLPNEAPRQYQPMTWDQVRRLEGRGLRFGPHTVTHPILSKTPDAQAREEIAGSWKRLQSQTGKPDPIFCYPNGQTGDFGEREFRILQECALKAAVAGTWGFATPGKLAAHPYARYRIPRYPLPDDPPRALQSVSGLDHWKSWVRARGTA